MDFALILFILVVITGIAWLADKLVFYPKRRLIAAQAVAEFEQNIGELAAQEADRFAQAHDRLREDKLRQPWWLEYSASFFPVILLVFLLRSFLVEPFRIPSGSMIPTLHIGDFVLVNKYQYGIRLPIINKKIIDIRMPHRGDVMVFRDPKDISTYVIKRIVGLPGDIVSYHNKRLLINGKLVPVTPLPDYFDENRIAYFKQFEENLGDVRHRILNDLNVPSYIITAQDYPFRQNCSYSRQGVRCKVPPAHYFVMGDNRDNSADSRYWGFVPERNIVGKAFLILMNFGNLHRIGRFQ